MAKKSMLCHQNYKGFMNDIANLSKSLNGGRVVCKKNWGGCKN
jgi:hypothetical protein